MNTDARLPLGQILVEKKIITQENVQTALHLQKDKQLLFGQALVQAGVLSDESEFLPFLASQLQVEAVNLKSLTVRPEVVQKFPVQFASFYQVIPIEADDQSLTVASIHPFDSRMREGIALLSPLKIKAVLCSEKDLREAIRKYYGVGAETIDRMMASREVATAQIPDETLEPADSEASVARFLQHLLLDAHRQRATDIHMEPYENELKIRTRIDGILYDTDVPVNIRHFKDAIISRIKIMSRLNIAEKRLPQDGRFKLRVEDVDLDLRVSFLPTPYGESAALRLLSSNKLYRMKEMGLSRPQRETIDRLLGRPYGIIFVTGPTGSGKTTTLYACLSQINKPEKKIITIEDPVEYQLKGITQVQINPSVGLSFARGLRSMLRHDPDVMMVGEVRDRETADIAVQVALTGHLVFSTLHTNDAASGVTRLLDMGVEPYLIASSVECFIAQRLVRLNCPKCKTSVQVTPEVLAEFGLEVGSEPLTIYTGSGCEHCGFTGYYGREAIYEFLILNDEVKEMILNRASAAQIRAKAVQQGMATLLDHGWEKVREGLTTPGEIIRVIKEQEK